MRKGIVKVYIKGKKSISNNHYYIMDKEKGKIKNNL